MLYHVSTNEALHDQATDASVSGTMALDKNQVTPVRSVLRESRSAIAGQLHRLFNLSTTQETTNF